MNEAWRFFLIFFGAMMVYNFILIRFIGLCPFFGISNRLETSIGMSISVVFVMVMASSVCWIMWNYVLEPLNIEFMYIVSFILVIAALVQFVEMVIKKTSPPLYKAMGIYLPLITTNCAVLAAVIESAVPGFMKLNINYSGTFPEALVFTIGVSLGFALVLILFSAMRERLDLAPVPKFFRGVPIAFIAAALYSLAFMGFSGMFGL